MNQWHAFIYTEEFIISLCSFPIVGFYSIQHDHSSCGSSDNFSIFLLVMSSGSTQE